MNSSALTPTTIPSCSPPTLTLPEIASWQFPKLRETLKEDKQRIFAAIPSLQRGAVWKPNQIEMLWDSILRGFPIGALVVCPKFEGQDYHCGKHGDGRVDKGAVTHYLLDGQQRCNAIALGFLDVLVGQPSATLWIDLNPEIPKNSTRQFVLRVLTTSHPWGYRLDDDAGFIGIGPVRDAVEKYAYGKRPVITSAWPHLSKCPVPFSWLTKATFDENCEASFWQTILEKCQLYASKTQPCDTVDQHTFLVHPWAVDAQKHIEDHLKSPQPTSHLSLIEAALQRMEQFRLVALEVPQEILQQENIQEPSQPEGDQRIYNVEHLFQRLNSAGTELRGEELLFSMIKAYWPGIEKSFDGIRNGHGNAFLPMPGSRLASLGFRAALMSAQNMPTMQASLTIPQIRSLAFAKDEKTREQHEIIKRYLGIPVHAENLSDLEIRESDFHKNLHQVDAWLLFDEGKQGDIGLPPVLRSNLAQGAPDLYLLLLHLAQRARVEGLRDEALTALKTPIVGLVTTLHWFGTDHEKVVKQVLQRLGGQPLTVGAFDGLLRSSMTAGSEKVELNILSPKELSDLIEPVHEADPQLHEWTLWKTIVEKETDPVLRQHAETTLISFVHKVTGCRPLLLYAQRSYLNREFLSYDPSSIDIWKGHNRPWDYDHLLPSAVLASNQRKYREACRQWVNTIGNFRAWPLEKNRGRHDEPANSSIQISDFPDSVIQDEKEIADFSVLWNDVASPIKAAFFMNAARGRMLRIYEEWFSKLEIANLLAEHPYNTSPVTLP